MSCRYSAMANSSSKVLQFTLTISRTSPPPTRVSLFHFHHRRRCCTISSTNNAATEPAVSSKVEGLQLIRSPYLVAMEYADLNLTDKFPEELSQGRVRQHVNPLSSSLMIPADIPDWSVVYKDATLPLMVDIGCGSGRFLMWHAKRTPNSKNYLGLEIRRKLVDRANYWAGELSLSNIHFIFANATVSFKQLISTYPGPLTLVSVLCPDPHFKKKYHKRRVVQKPLVEAIISRLAPGGQVFIHSDVLEVAMDMRDRFDAESDKLLHINNVDPDTLCDGDGWLLNNPMGIRTEREIHAEFEGARIYRRLYQKQMNFLSNFIALSLHFLLYILEMLHLFFFIFLFLFFLFFYGRAC